MKLFLECTKVKRTGFVPLFAGGTVLAAAIPLINMSVRSELYVGQKNSPLHILLAADWQMMAMINLLLAAAGACLLYHTEYVDNGMQKIRSLPVREGSVFLGKVILTSIAMAIVFAIEGAVAAFCICNWFDIETSYGTELLKAFGYSLLLMLPCVVLSLLISQAFQNMWISLGISVICVFTATMLPADSFILSLFPFALPFQMLPGTDAVQAACYLCSAGIELMAISLAELVFLKIRRSFV